MNSLAQIYDREFRVRGLRQQGWGRGLLATAALIWLWMGYLLVFPFSIDRGGDFEPIECESRVFHQDRGSDRAGSARPGRKGRAPHPGL